MEYLCQISVQFQRPLRGVDSSLAYSPINLDSHKASDSTAVIGSVVGYISLPPHVYDSFYRQGIRNESELRRNGVELECRCVWEDVIAM